MKRTIKNLLVIITVVLFNFSENCLAELGWNWTHTFGGDSEQELEDMVLDSLGNTYIVGFYVSEMNIDTISFKPDSNNLMSGFVAKLNNSGELIWANQIDFNNGENIYAKSVALDTNLNVYVVGYTDDKETYLIKYTNDGEELWIQKFADNGFWHSDKAKALIVEKDIIWLSGAKYIKRFTHEGTLMATRNMSSFCIINNNDKKLYAAYGNQIFIMDTLLNVNDTITLDSTSINIYAMAILDSTIYLAGGMDDYGNGRESMYSAKLSLTNQVIWSARSIRMEEFSEAPGKAILIDSSGNVYISGEYRQLVGFDSIEIGARGFGGMYVLTLDDTTGHLENLVYAESDAAIFAKAIMFQPNHNLLVAGTFRHPYSVSVNFGDNIVTCEGGSDIYLASLSEPDIISQLKGSITLNGEPLWTYVEILRENPDSTYKLIYRGQTDNMGKYSFTVNRLGNYLVKTNTFNEVKTYYTKTYIWTSADILNIEQDTILDDIDIEVIQCSPLDGEDSISGTIYSYDGSVKSFNDVLLVNDENQLMAFTRADTLGFYYFANVPQGNFKILVDSAGILMDSYYTINNNIVKSSSNLNGKIYPNCDYIFGIDNKIYMKESEIINPVSDDITEKEQYLSSGFNFYPNPSSGVIYVDIPKELKSVSLCVIDLSGKIILSNNYNNPGTVRLSLGKLSKGFYLMHIVAVEAIFTKKFILK